MSQRIERKSFIEKMIVGMHGQGKVDNVSKMSERAGRSRTTKFESGRTELSMDPWSKLINSTKKLLFRMISSRNLYNVKFNGIELESKLLKSTSDREIATTLNFINLGIDLQTVIRIPTLKLKIHGKLFLKVESRTSVTFTKP